VRALSGTEGPEGPVALVLATGQISMHASRGLLGGAGGIAESELGPILTKLAKEDRVKAVVLRIDSPGGSALASDLLWHEIMNVRAKKPVVVSVGTMAASGGYYMASAGSHVMVDGTSILGSIGVVGGKVAIGHALERLGIHGETLSPKGQPMPSRAAAESIMNPYDHETREKLMGVMNAIYKLFLARIAEGRNTTPEKVAPHAEGRLFSGRDAIARGLADEVGGLAAAVAKAKALAKLPEDATVYVANRPRSFLDSLGGGDDDDDARATFAAELLRQIEATPPTSWSGPVLAAVLPFVKAIEPLAAGEKTGVFVPFAILVE
jgi:protease-4